MRSLHLIHQEEVLINMFGQGLQDQAQQGGGQFQPQMPVGQPEQKADPVAEINQKLDAILQLLTQDQQADAQPAQPQPQVPGVRM